MTQQFHFLGVDPDLLVFGKYFTSNVRVLPHHYSRVNASEPLPSDKRQFIHPPPPAALPLTSAPSVKPHITASTVPITPSTTITPQSTNQPSTVPTITAALSSTAETPLASGNHAQTHTPTISTTSLALSSTVPPSSTAATTVSPYIPETPAGFSPTAARPFTSPAHHHTTPPTPTATMGVESSRQYPNDTKGNLGRNHTAGSEEGQGVSEEDTFVGLGLGWHVAAQTVLVVVAICITVLLSCCCSILLVVSWRGQRKRMGRYRTSRRGKRGSMRLIKYVLVRENT